MLANVNYLNRYKTDRYMCRMNVNDIKNKLLEADKKEEEENEANK